MGISPHEACLLAWLAPVLALLICPVVKYAIDKGSEFLSNLLQAAFDLLMEVIGCYEIKVTKCGVLFTHPPVPPRPTAAEGTAPIGISMPSQGGCESLQLDTLDNTKRRQILATLFHYGWDKVAAARALEITPTVLDKKIREYGLCPDQAYRVQDAGNPPRLDTLDNAKRRQISATLEHFQWVKKSAAVSLGIHRSTLDRMIEKYHLHPPEAS